ncbi:2Fe-2S iron-sulfur cluster-binding protein [Candidatus Omnitrophota bacterium]
MPKLTIDNLQVEVAEGSTVLQAAQKLGIEIPTLCFHQALGPYGACRVCMVEAVAHGRTKLATACTYPAWDGLEVKTNTERVIRARKFALELLLARCPNVQPVQELAKELGVQPGRLKSGEPDEDCILCGMCVRVCRDIVGQSAISFVNRGIAREVQTPFAEHSEDCIGCGACAFVCPTGAIKIEDIDQVRKIHYCNTELQLVGCADCGRHFATKKELEKLKAKIELPDQTFKLCPDCRRKSLRSSVCQK